MDSQALATGTLLIVVIINMIRINRLEKQNNDLIALLQLLVGIAKQEEEKNGDE